MTLFELAEVVQGTLEFRRYPLQDGRITCSFERCEIKGTGVLIGKYGNGYTFQEAMKDYANEIQGQILVFDAHTDRRKEFGVPPTLEKDV